MSRKITTLSDNWKFSRDFPEETRESAEFSLKKDFEDGTWRTVSVPHDWAIEGPFSPDYDLQNVKVHADGIFDETPHIGRTGGLPHVGLGVYRRKFTVSDTSKRIFLEFDGVMSYSEIYINGKKVYERPYGYISYSVEVTDFVTEGENQLAVLANPKSGASRWYPGAGIYRPVRLVEVNDCFVSFQGTFVTTEITELEAKVKISTELQGKFQKNQIQQILLAPNGMELDIITRETAEKVEMEFSVQYPQLWDLEQRNLYKIRTNILKNGGIIDHYETKFGIRSMKFSRKEGFQLNGKRIQFRGVCLHHDGGMLGGIENASALRRQFSILKAMGVNAIRCSHNPESRTFMDLCDEMGFLVIPEAFDEWKMPKIPNSYSLLFDDWAETDLVDFIRRDRNHPSVMMWSIGNEIREQRVAEGIPMAKLLCDICKREDPTRPTTAGINSPEPAILHGFCDMIDIIGLNYKPNSYERYLKEHPDWIIFGSETEAVTSSRGVYHQPVKEDFTGDPHCTGHLSSYDVTGLSWSCPPEQEFAAQEDNPEILGQFVWTGFDYLGEPSPYRANWPNHAAYFGIMDMAGIPKDRFYGYQAQWTKTPVVHLFPHWNWSGYEKIDVHCYSNCHSVELFVNGHSKGEVKKNENLKIQEESGKCDQLERFRFIWKDVPYVAGEIKAVGYDEEGKFIKSHTIKTAGNPSEIVLIPEKSLIETEELSYIRVKIVDQEGNLCPNADTDVTFSVEGAGVYLASDSGDQTSLRMFTESHCPVFHGQCTLVLRGMKEGIVKVSATASGLSSGKTTLMVSNSKIMD